MMDRTELLTRLLLVLALAPACGAEGDNATLTIANEPDDDGVGLDITSVLVRACITRYWEPDAPAFDPVRDLPAEGALRIEHGKSRELELIPGCHDVLATRAERSGASSERSAVARVVLDAGESAVWVPWRVKENDSWW